MTHPFLTSRACLAAVALAFPAIPVTAADSALPEVRTVDMTNVKPADFSDEDIDLPYYLFHFHSVANAVESTGPDRGFIHINVWRRSDQAYNARVMENVLSLAWFYCADRKWNPYRGDAALRARLEAALDFWTREQLPDGQFPQSGPGKGDLAATAFATKFVGEALLLLHSGPPIDAAILERAEAADRRAIEAVLTQPKMYSDGSKYENQFGGVWVGGLAYFAIHPDPGLRALWEKVYHRSRADFQSPAGYYYEKRGPDFEYTMDTHGHNSRQIWPWLRGTPLGDELVAKDAAWFDWLAYNAPPEPDGAGFILNRAIETRQRAAAFSSYETPLGESIPLVRAFSESVEERAARCARKRAALAAAWPAVAPLQLGEMTAFSPYVFLHRRSPEWLPTTAQRDAARALLPVNARDHFTQQRRDSNQNVVFTFARRPAYYAAFTSGNIITTQQRYGLGLLWTPKLGAVLQSQTGPDPAGHPHRLPSQADSNAAAWGTQPAAAATVSEASEVKATFSLGKAPLPESAIGIHELPDAEVAARYPIEGGGEKTVTFGDESVRVAVRCSGEFSETLPILVPADGHLVPTSRAVTLETPRGSFRVSFGAGVNAAISDPSTSVLKKRLVVVTLRGRGELSYTLENGK